MSSNNKIKFDSEKLKKQATNIKNNASKNIDKFFTYLTTNSKAFGLLELTIFIILLLIFYKFNIFNVSTNYPSLVQLFLLIITFVMIVSFFFVKERGNFKTPYLSTYLSKTFYTILAIILCVIIFILIFWLINNFSSLQTITIFVISILAIFGLLSLVYLAFKKTIDKFKNKHDLFIQLITNIFFYIPCLFVEFIEYIKYEYKITSSTVWIIFLIELLLITLYFILPIIWSKIAISDGTQLLKDPVYLFKKRTLGTFEDLHKNNINKTDNKFNYNYSLSFWYYINPQPPSTNKSYTKYTNILSYGNKPVIEYNGKKNTLRIRTENKLNKLVEIYLDKNIQYQKWNNMVINYDGANMDVFINSKLVGTQPNIAPYMTYENVTIGSDNGIHGGICNIKYYDRPLTKNDIEITYKILKNKHRPLF
jgi:hypothetical protein